MRADIQGNASIELACGLAEEVVRAFGEVRLRVFGTSMVPSILPGDLVLIQRASLHEISPGEVVLFLQEGRLFVHRVVGRKVAASADRPEESWLITRGDRLRHEDPPVTAPELLGRLVSIERDNQKVGLPAHEPNRLIVRLLQSSDRVTYLYLRLAAGWRNLFLRRAKCQA
ncbi:MAG TPA: S24/S26 family peptidase [Verrucomicrobiae bacterium]|nr:S24/S26 family peptidase [Verrucomicrobiae bacterium]